MDLSQLPALIAMFTGKTGTQTSTQTEGQQVSPEALAAILKSGLEQGMPALQGGAGQKGAGLYNSSTNSLLQNDLQARLAAEAAKLSTQKTTSNTTNSKADPSLNPGKTAMLAGGGMALNSLMKAMTGKEDNSMLGGLINPALQLAKGGLGSLWQNGVGQTPVNQAVQMPTSFDSNPIFQDFGLAQAGMGYNDPAAMMDTSWINSGFGGTIDQPWWNGGTAADVGVWSDAASGSMSDFSWGDSGGGASVDLGGSWGGDSWNMPEIWDIGSAADWTMPSIGDWGADAGSAAVDNFDWGSILF